MRTMWGPSLFVSLLVAVQASALPVLSEVFYDADGSDDGFVFVEIYGEAGTLLDGLTIEGINGSDGGVTASLDGMSDNLAIELARRIVHLDHRLRKPLRSSILSFTS